MPGTSTAFEDPDGRFARLVAEHQATLRSFVRMLGVQPHWVDDVSQEVFLIAYRRFADFDDNQGDFHSWLRGIARKQVANERRRELRRSRLVQHELLDLLAEAVDEDQGAVGQQMVHDALKGCLDALPAHSRELIRMRYEEDLDAETMGAAIGREGNAVRQSLFRVRELLRRCVGGKLGTQAWS
jgi:RNA polymerase sigma-70 factor (ECF subfamily)